MDGLTPPPGGDQNRGPAVVSLYFTIFGLSFILLCLRFGARIRIRALGWDDWIMAFAVVILLALTITGTELAAKGGSRHLYYVIADYGPDRLVEVLKLYYIVQPLAFMGIAISRISVALLVLRIVGLSVWRKRFLWFTVISTLVITIVVCVLIFCACKPVEALWNPFIQSNCWDPVIVTNLTIFSSSWNVFMDICFAILPVTIFWNLQLKLNKRIGLSFLMGMGVFAAISGAIKTSKLYESIESDVTWDSYDLFQWNGAETFLIIVCGCLPTLKPIYDCCLGRKLSSKSKCSSYHHPSGSRVSKKYFWNVSGNSDLESQRQSAIILEPQRAALRDTKDRIHVAHRIDVDVSSRRSGDDDEINNIGRGTSEWERDGHQGLRGVRYAASWDKIGEEGV